MANLFSCVEYKKDGNSVKIVRRELLPVAGCSSVFSCVECVDYGSFTRELVAIYKGANGYALRIAGGAERVENYNREALECIDSKSVCELIREGVIFAGRAALEFVQLSASVEEWRECVQLREEFDKEQERKEQEREEAERKAREEEEKKAKEREESIILEAYGRIVGGNSEEWISAEALELMAREYGVNMHPRTVSALRANVKEVRSDGQQIRPLRIKSKKGAKLSFDGVFSLMAEVIKAVKSVDGFLSGEALAL